MRDSTYKFVMVTANTAAAIAADTEPMLSSEKSSENQSVPELKACIETARARLFVVFAEPPGLPPNLGTHHVIPLGPISSPPFQHMYRLSPKEQNEVHQQTS